MDEAHLVYGKEKRLDLAAGQHLLQAEWVHHVTDAWASHRLAVFGDRNQLDLCEWDRRGERECLMVPPARIRDLKPMPPETWKRVRRRRLLAEKKAWPVCCCGVIL